MLHISYIELNFKIFILALNMSQGMRAQAQLRFVNSVNPKLKYAQCIQFQSTSIT
jgi:hypothetical protein